MKIQTQQLKPCYVLKREAELAKKLMYQKNFSVGVMDALSTIANAYKYGLAVPARMKNVLVECVVDVMIT